MFPHTPFSSPAISRTSLCALVLTATLSSRPVRADVRLPAILGDHMVLQRDLDGAPLWGWADPGEAVTVSAGNERVTATAGPDGRWAVKLPKLAASSKPLEITVQGKNSITLHDVLVGDVWLCSGQSNMELGSGFIIPREEIAQAGNPEIRLFNVPKWVAPAPATDIAPAPPNVAMLGKWQVCTPETLVKNGEWVGFSAVGFLFGQKIQAFTKQPVGLIESSWGGTRIHSWMSRKMLESMPEKVSAARGAANFEQHYDEIKKTYEMVTLPQWKEAVEKWKVENKAALDAYDQAQKDWEQQAKDAVAQNKPRPPRPRAPQPPREPVNPLTNNQTSAALFNGMISPIIPFGIKGAIWYQGESNANEPLPYRAEMPALIKDWRSRWQQGDFPFLLVQLPNYMQRQANPSDSNWVRTREAQTRALELPNTGMAVTLDIGDAGNIHPPDKWDVAHRLALQAQRVAYWRNDVVASGPTYKSLKVEGDKIRIAFDNVGSGLVIGNPPERFFTSQKKPVPQTAPVTLQGFAVAGADQKYVWAQAVIEGNEVVVGSEAVPNPVTVRYAWADNPDANLYNKEGLPAAPFRTDDFPLKP